MTGKNPIPDPFWERAEAQLRLDGSYEESVLRPFYQLIYDEQDYNWILGNTTLPHVLSAVASIYNRDVSDNKAAEAHACSQVQVSAVHHMIENPEENSDAAGYSVIKHRRNLNQFWAIVRAIAGEEMMDVEAVIQNLERGTVHEPKHETVVSAAIGDPVWPGD
jgi:hypothetical protein